MNETAERQRHNYLQQLEYENPGYAATDTGREIVLNPLSRISEKERLKYEARLAAFVTNQTVNKDI